jgi:hypothetical protein
VLVRDERRAVHLYELLLPHADDNAHTYTQQPFGPVALRLGKLAALLGRWQDADRHFANALARCELLGAPAIRARVLLEYARALATRDEPADRVRVEALRAEAEELCAELDIPDLLERVPLPREPRPGPEPEDAVFKHEGDFWTIAFEGRTFRLRDVKGLGYIATLLASPGRDVHVLELLGAVAGTNGASTADEAPVLDDQAKQEYASRLAALEEELDEARDWGDTERASRLGDEVEALTQELARAVGLRGRDRAFSSPAERARISVTKAIRTAIRLIDKESPSLAAHLDASIQTGRFCSYATRGARPPAWSL